MQQYAGCEQNKIHTFLYSHMVLSDTWNEKKGAFPGLTMLMVSTTGEHYAYYQLVIKNGQGFQNMVGSGFFFNMVGSGLNIKFLNPSKIEHI